MINCIYLSVLLVFKIKLKVHLNAHYFPIFPGMIEQGPEKNSSGSDGLIENCKKLKMTIGQIEQAITGQSS